MHYYYFQKVFNKRKCILMVTQDLEPRCHEHWILKYFYSKRFKKPKILTFWIFFINFALKSRLLDWANVTQTMLLICKSIIVTMTLHTIYVSAVFLPSHLTYRITLSHHLWQVIPTYCHVTFTFQSPAETIN